MKWDKVYLLRGKYAQQKRLERAVLSLFSVYTPFKISLLGLTTYSLIPKQQHEVKVNVREAAQLINPETESYLEVDIFIPALNLAFEFQVNFLTPYICTLTYMSIYIGASSLRRTRQRGHALAGSRATR